MSKKKIVPNPMRALVAPLLTRLAEAITLANDLSIMSAANLRKEGNSGKSEELTGKFHDILMDLSVLEGFTLPDAEPTPEAPVAPEPPTPEYKQAVAAWRKNGFKIMGRNLEAIQAALVSYEAGLVDAEEEAPQEEAPQAETPPPADAPPPVEPPPVEPPQAEPPPADGPAKKQEGEPEAPPPPKAEAPRADPPPPVEPPPVPPVDEGPKPPPPPADPPPHAEARKRWGPHASDAPPPADAPPPREERAETPKPPPAAKATVTPVEGWKWWEVIGCGVAVLVAAFMVVAAIVWVNGYQPPETAPPPAPQPTVTVAPPAPTPPAPTPVPTPPAPVPVVPATPSTTAVDQPLDCSGATGNITLEGVVYTVIPVHNGDTTIFVSGWAVDGGACKASGDTITTNDFNKLREGLKKALGSDPSGMSQAVKVGGRTVRCNQGFEPGACFK